MSVETRPLDSKSPYEIATAGRRDPRSDFEVKGDMIDPHLFDLYRKLGLFETKDGDTFSRESVMDMLKETWLAGADFEKKNIRLSLTD